MKMKANKVKYIVLTVILALVLAFTATVPVACSCNPAGGSPLGTEMPKDAPEFEIEKIADFANGANEDVVYARDGDGNSSVFNVEWNAENVEFVDDVARMKISEIPDGTESQWGDYYGAELRTNMWYHYGYYSVSMKPSNDPGTASTFFTYTGPYGEYDEEGNLHPWDEIDIEFLGKDTTKVQFNYYTNGGGEHEYMYDLGFDASEDFHTYGFLWEEDAITWYVDSVAVYRVDAEQAATHKNPGLPSTPGRIMLNHWCGTEDAEGWMDAYEGYSSPVEYQWIGTTSDPIEPITTPPGGGEDTPSGEVSFTPGETIAPAFVNANGEAGAYTIEPSEDGKTVDVSYENIAAASYGENICTTAVTTAEGKNAYAMTVTNNGDTAVNLRVDVMDESIPTPEGVSSLNHRNLNTTAVQDGEIVAGATDKVWGGSKFTVGAGETSEIVVMYDTENFASGKDGKNDLYETTGEFSVSKVTVFIDSHMAEGGPYSGDVTIKNVNFGTAEIGESDLPEADKTVPANSNGAALTGFYQWGNYTLTPSADSTSLRVSYSGLGQQYAGVGGSIASLVGTNNSVTMKLENCSDKATTVKVDVGNQPDGGDLITKVTSAKYNDGTDHTIDISADGAKFDIPANKTVTVTVGFAVDEDQPITNMNFFFDSLTADFATAYGNIVISEVDFTGGEDPAPTPGGDEETATGESMAGAYKWGDKSYTLTPSADGKVLTVTYDGLSQYAGMGMDIAAGANNTVTLTIKNNGTAAADVKVDVGYAETEGGALIVLNSSASYNDGTEHESTLGGDKGAYFNVAAGGTLTVTLTCDTTEHAIEKMNLMIDSYGENYATASGNIELSVLTFKTV